MIGFAIVSVVISALAAFYFVRISNAPGGLAKVRYISLAAAVVSLLVLSPAVGLQMVLTCVASILCKSFNSSRRDVKAALIFAPIISYAIMLCFPVVELRELAKLREKYPEESLAARLEYENRRNPVPNTLADSGPKLSFAVAQQLGQFEQLEQDTSFNERRLQLEKLHDHQTQQFILAQGFGPARMAGMRVAPTLGPDDEAGPISLAPPPTAAAPPPPSDSGTPSQQNESAAAAPLAKGLLESLHFDGRNDFLNDREMGYVRDRNHVTGFRSHHFTKLPTASDESWRRAWRISRLELIGILKYDTPKAYISTNLPRLDELADAPTRDLDAFETAALVRLRTQEDVVIEETVGRIRMLGSLRAGYTCLECHNARRGDLLGALSYELLPLKSGPSPARSVEGMTMQWRRQRP